MPALSKFTLLIGFLAVLSIPAAAQTLGDPDCGTLLLVSGFNSNNVKIYDGCDGQFIRNLDDTGTLAGPQAIVETLDGDILVVSEQNHRVVRFDRQTLSFAEIVVGDDPQTPEDESSGLLSPTGAAIDADGLLYVGSFSQHRVQRFNPDTGQDLGTFVPTSTGGIAGIDAGMAFGPDGNLNIPGFDSNSVLRVNGQTGAALPSSIPAATGGLNAPRVVAFSPDGQRMLVSSWRSGQILEYAVGSGAFIGQFGPTIDRVTGIGFGPDNVLYATNSNTDNVIRINATTGAFMDLLVPAGSGGLNGATFVFALSKQAGMVDAGTPQQFWLTGLGEIVGNSILVPNMRFTTGGVFGDAFDAAQIQRHSWGPFEIIFNSCDSGEMSFSATAESSGLFGSGGYTVVRLLPNAAGDSCLTQGFDNVVNGDWMSGTWAGIPERSGEGFFIDAANGNQVAVAWFTYMPTGFSFPEG